MVRTSGAIAPFMPLAGRGTRFQPVWVGDVARAVVTCLQQPSTIGQTYELCGPDVMTLGELVHKVQSERLESPSIIVVGDVVQGARAWAAQPQRAQKLA